MSGNNDKQISLKFYLAKPDSDNEELRKFTTSGEELKLKSHKGGYLTNAFMCSEKLDMSGVRAGRGKGYIVFSIADGGDEVGSEIAEKWCQGHVEVIAMYREFKLEEGEWVNKKAVCAWGYIASNGLKPGPCTLALEAHVVRTVLKNDAIGTDDYTVDCINGETDIKGTDVQRKPTFPPEKGSAKGNFAALLSA